MSLAEATSSSYRSSVLFSKEWTLSMPFVDCPLSSFSRAVMLIPLMYRSRTSQSSPVTSPRRRLSSPNLVNSQSRPNTILKARKFLFMLSSRFSNVDEGEEGGSREEKVEKRKMKYLPKPIPFFFVSLDLSGSKTLNHSALLLPVAPPSPDTIRFISVFSANISIFKLFLILAPRA